MKCGVLRTFGIPERNTMGDLLFAAVVTIALVSVPFLWKRPRRRRTHAAKVTGTTGTPGAVTASDDGPDGERKHEPRNFWEEFGDTRGDSN